MEYPKWPLYATSVHKAELLTKNEIVLPPKQGVCGGGYVMLDVEVRFAWPVEEMEHDDAARRRWRRMDFIENR